MTKTFGDLKKTFNRANECEYFRGNDEDYSKYLYLHFELVKLLDKHVGGVDKLQDKKTDEELPPEVESKYIEFEDSVNEHYVLGC